LENGKICQVKNLENEVGFGSTEFMIFRGKENLSGTDFIYYVTRTDYVRNAAVQAMTGTSGESTFYHAFEYLRMQRPKVLFLSVDGTDDHSHSGRYGEYLIYANKADQMIEEMWNWLQSQDDYNDKTTLIITTDHGRGKGSNRSWKTHGRWALGSNQIWMAVLGPDTPPLGEMKTNARYYQKQIAKTVASFLGMGYNNSRREVGEIIRPMLHPNTSSLTVTHSVVGEKTK